MRYRYAAASFILPFVLYAGGCGGAPNSLGCPVDPQCYVVSPSGECSADPAAVCSGGSWTCSTDGKLGSGCMPDGGIAPPPQDAGACILATLEPPLACNDDTTCLPYDGHCEFDALTGAGTCACGLPAPDSGSDACVLDCYGDICSLPSFTITCSGGSDVTTCAPYNATCEITDSGGGAPPEYVCECGAEDPPHGGDTGN